MQYTLKELRARKNETQEQTAKALGLTVPAYCRIEKIDAKLVNKMARHFGVAAEEIKLIKE